MTNLKLFDMYQVRQAFLRAEGNCEICGRWVDDGAWEIHHRKPRSLLKKSEIDELGPGGGLGNALLCCRECHREVHDGKHPEHLLHSWEEIC